uniref:hypothetical protein n=1 Tax=Thaumasiovibrio occultus TaxID=1891184 RepID=UPI000B3555E8|nr:hypothetical protein [Thaumasiovibrio occultus]
MKKTVSALMLIALLAACEDANQAIDQAQDAANSAVDSLQDKMENVDFSELKLDQLGDVQGLAKELAESAQAAMNVDFSDNKAINQAKESIANTYACLVDASSESTAEKIMNKVIAVVTNEEAKNLLEQSMDRAKEMSECVM